MFKQTLVDYCYYYSYSYNTSWMLYVSTVGRLTVAKDPICTPACEYTDVIDNQL